MRARYGGYTQITFATGPDPQNRFQQILQSVGSLRVLDAEGREMQCFQSMATDSPTVGCSVSYTFGAQIGTVAPKRLVWEIPTIVKTVDIPIDFHDLNLNFANAGHPSAAPAEGNDDRAGNF